MLILVYLCSSWLTLSWLLFVYWLICGGIDWSWVIWVVLLWFWLNLPGLSWSWLFYVYLWLILNCFGWSWLTLVDIDGSQLILVFKASALWADAFYKSKCPSVCGSVCLCVRLSVHFCGTVRWSFYPHFPKSDVKYF